MAEIGDQAAIEAWRNWISQSRLPKLWGRTIDEDFIETAYQQGNEAEIQTAIALLLLALLRRPS